MSEKTYRIKPLEWKSHRTAYREELWTRPPGRCYSIARTRGGVERRWTRWYLEIRDYSGNHVVGTFGYYYHLPPKMAYRTSDDAKAAAEANWRETITKFLEEVDHE